MAREIMYIGKKPTKRDNVNDEPNRIWAGLGDTIAVSDAEARKLLQPAYADVWIDATDMDQAGRSKLIAELRDRFRAEQRKITPADDLSKALSALSDDQLAGELSRRRAQDGRADQNALPPPQLPGSKLTTDPSLDPNAPERPSNTNDLIEEIAGTLLGLDKENKGHFDSDGYPIMEAVQEALGYKISKSELDNAVKLIKAA